MCGHNGEYEQNFTFPKQLWQQLVFKMLDHAMSMAAINTMQLAV